MEAKKRQISTSFRDYEDSKKQKTQITTDETTCTSRKTISCFEDLANELIYEIFGFLDYFHVYEAFFNLNHQFRSLFTNSNLPIKINILSMSKSALKRYNTDIIQTSIHRIDSIHFFHVFMYDLALSSIFKLSEFQRLKTLILHNIESKCLENLLNQLPSLSLLSSLVITSVDIVKNKNNIYRQIFRLSTLKYCKLSLLGWTTSESLPVSTNEYSSIEHLIITNYMYIHQLDNFLSYVPQLRRLSFHLQQDTWQERTKICPFVLNHLTHISFRLDSIKFDQFEQLVTDHFPMIQVLHLTLAYHAGRAYLDTEKWEQLIISHKLNLRIFDIQLDISIGDDDDQLRLETQINRFRTPFWIERQWFFTHQFYHTRYGNRLIFYSTNPYRRIYYTLHKQLNANTSLDHYQSRLDSVQHVHIHNEKSVLNCMKYIPKATELTFKDEFSTTHTSIATILNRIIPLKQLTKLVIECQHFSFKKMIELLSFTPNIHTLTFKSIVLYKYDHISIEQSENFRLVSNTNNITHVTFTDKCTLEKLKLLLALCPRVQHLSINTLVKDLEPIVRFLLDRTNQNTCHLCSLCFSKECSDWSVKLDMLIKSETLLDDYTLKLVDPKLYLWW